MFRGQIQIKPQKTNSLKLHTGPCLGLPHPSTAALALCRIQMLEAINKVDYLLGTLSPGCTLMVDLLLYCWLTV